MKDYGAYRGDNPGQVILNTRLGVLGTVIHPFTGFSMNLQDTSRAVKRKDEVAVYLHPEKGTSAQVRFSKTDLRDWCHQVLEMLG